VDDAAGQYSQAFIGGAPSPGVAGA
jgi:hypothetical protein